MTETVIKHRGITVVTFRIEDGVIVEATEEWSNSVLNAVLTLSSDIERAVARVANTPVGGREGAEK